MGSLRSVGDVMRPQWSIPPALTTSEYLGNLYTYLCPYSYPQSAAVPQGRPARHFGGHRCRFTRVPFPLCRAPLPAPPSFCTARNLSTQCCLLRTGDSPSIQSPVSAVAPSSHPRLDVKDLAIVVNFNMPDSIKKYIHRIGRTGRAGCCPCHHNYGG